MQPARHSTGWYLASSTFWFAQSFKWFILLLLTLSAQIAQMVPESQRNTAIGTVMAAGAAWAAVGPFLMGWLSYRVPARFGRQRSWLFWGALGTTGALLLLANATSIPMMIGAYLLVQITDDMGTGPYSGLIAESVSQEQRGKASGIIAMQRFVAQVLGGVFGALFAQNLMGVYAGIAVVTVGFALVTIASLRGEAPFVPPKTNQVSLGDLVREFLAPWRNRDFVLVFAITWIGNFGYYLIQTYLQNFFRDRIEDYRVLGRVIDLGVLRVDIPERAIMFLGLGISLVGVFGALMATGVIDRIGRKRTVLVGGLLMGLPLIPFGLVHNFQLTVLLAPVFGIGLGLYQSSSWALVSDVLPDREAVGKDMGIWQAAFSSVQIGSGLVGALVDSLNRQGGGLGYTAMFLIGATLLMLGAVLATRVRGST